MKNVEKMFCEEVDTFAFSLFIIIFSSGSSGLSIHQVLFKDLSLISPRSETAISSNLQDLNSSRSQIHVTTGGQSVFMSTPTCNPKPDFSYCQTVARLFMWRALSNERTGL
jgi:hypothetical protein